MANIRLKSVTIHDMTSASGKTLITIHDSESFVPPFRGVPTRNFPGGMAYETRMATILVWD